MTNARSLANFATGIGTEGAVLTVDNTNNRIGIATTNPQNDLQVGAGITMEGDTGQVTFVGIVTAEGFRNSDGSVVGAGSTDNIITGTAATFTSDVNIADSIIHVGDTNTKIRFPAADTFTIETGGTERIRVGSAGSVSIGPIDSSSIATLSAAGSNTDLRLRAVGSGGFFDVETNSESRLRITSAGRIGIGTGSPGGLLTVYGDPAEVRIQHDGNSSYSRLISDSNNQFNIYTGGGPNLAMVIDSNQDVGIGTTNPGTKLDVRGGNWANGDIVVGEKDNAGRIKFARGADGSDSGSIGFAAADSNSVLSMNVASGDGTLTFQTNSTERVRITSGGDVGIGSQSPARKLDVDGIARFIETVEAYNTSGGSQDWFVSSASFGFHDGNGVGFDAGGGLFRLAISGTERVRINSGGDVNITGITTASQFDATSDVALKENIEVIDEPITKISELKGVTFDWKKGGHSVGVIAQDVEKVLPTAVGGSKDQKTVNYNAIIGLLVESVKDQQKQIEELKSLLDK